MRRRNLCRPKRGRLFQETLRRRPFWMLVACQLVNLTTWEQARPALRSIMRRYTIRDLAKARPRELHMILRPLGLWRRRADILPRMARHWLEYRSLDDMVGVGQYARHSWEIFMEGRRPRGVRDGKLRWYLNECRPRGSGRILDRRPRTQHR